MCCTGTNAQNPILASSVGVGGQVNGSCRGRPGLRGVTPAPVAGLLVPWAGWLRSVTAVGCEDLLISRPSCCCALGPVSGSRLPCVCGMSPCLIWTGRLLAAASCESCRCPALSPGLCRASVCVCVCISTSRCICPCECMCVCVSVAGYMCTHVPIYVSRCACLSVHM